MKRLPFFLFGCWLGDASAWVAKSIIENPMPFLTCRDVLFDKNMSTPSDMVVDQFLTLAYIYCIGIKAMEEKSKQTLPYQKDILARLDRDRKILQKAVDPILCAHPIGDFIFSKTALREQMNRDIQNRSGKTD